MTLKQQTKPQTGYNDIIRVHLSEVMDKFVSTIRFNSTDKDVSFKLLINSEGYEFTTERRTSEQLKENSISMKNLRGSWIEERKAPQ